MYEGTVESTHFRALCLPPPQKENTGDGMLDATSIKRRIEEVLDQKWVITMPRETLTKGFPLSDELQRQLVHPGFKLPQLPIYFGKEDPEKHLQHFMAVVVLHG